MSFPKSAPVLILCVLAVVLTAAPALPRANMTVVQDEAFPTRQRPAVVFEHDGHNVRAGVYDCSVCHHVYEDGERVEGLMSVGQECSDCHGLEESEDNAVPLREAYHTQCMGCHGDTGKGPLACGECHVQD
ncbi:MAG: cytochrome c family protein [Desulfohalobiaceae bacterium]|nr:cytochrome c family protein [Desulfohalobiaceae bacterium]